MCGGQVAVVSFAGLDQITQRGKQRVGPTVIITYI